MIFKGLSMKQIHQFFLDDESPNLTHNGNQASERFSRSIKIASFLFDFYSIKCRNCSIYRNFYADITRKTRVYADTSQAPRTPS